MDLTIIPDILRTDENAIYLLCIIDQFSKFANAYILNSKKSDIILGNIKSFINAYGKPNTLHCDNGKEFSNELLNSFCEENNIKFIHGRPYHPQSQGCIESFQKELKRLLEAKYLENKKKLSIYTTLPEVINIYNSNLHSSTKYKPNILFYVKDNSIIEKVLSNLKKSQNKFKNSVNSIKINSKCLLCENFVLKDKTICFKKFKKKENIIFLVK